MHHCDEQVNTIISVGFLILDECSGIYLSAIVFVNIGKPSILICD